MGRSLYAATPRLLREPGLPLAMGGVQRVGWGANGDPQQPQIASENPLTRKLRYARLPTSPRKQRGIINGLVLCHRPAPRDSRP